MQITFIRMLWERAVLLWHLSQNHFLHYRITAQNLTLWSGLSQTTRL